MESSRAKSVKDGSFESGNVGRFEDGNCGADISESDEGNLSVVEEEIQMCVVDIEQLDLNLFRTDLLPSVGGVYKLPQITAVI